MEKHKPCPFCKGDFLVLREKIPVWVIKCVNCDASGPYAFYRDEAWEEWDRRDNG